MKECDERARMENTLEMECLEDTDDMGTEVKRVQTCQASSIPATIRDLANQQALYWEVLELLLRLLWQIGIVYDLLEPILLSSRVQVTLP